MGKATAPAAREAKRGLSGLAEAAGHFGRAATSLRDHAPDVMEEARGRLKAGSREARKRAEDLRDRAEAEISDLRDLAGTGLGEARVMLHDGFAGNPMATVLAAAGAGFFLGLLLSGRRA